MAAQAQETNEGQIDKKEKENKNDGDCIDLEPKSDYPWYFYTYNANNKYFINIQWKMKGDGQYAWRKHGARNCTINGKSTKLLSLTKKPHVYQNMCEYVRISLDNKEYRLYNHKQLGWCFDDGQGVFFGIKMTNNGKMQ